MVHHQPAVDRVDIYRCRITNRRPPAAADAESHAFARDSSTAYVTMQDSDELVAIDPAAHKEIRRMKTGNNQPASG